MLKRVSEFEFEPDPPGPLVLVAEGLTVVTKVPRKYDVSSRECYRNKVGRY
jgi:hypothetical protein